MLPAADVLALREAITASLPDSCTVRRVTRTPDGAGGCSETESTVAETRCRAAPAGQNEAEIGARLGVAALWALTLPAGTDIREADRIVCRGRTWEVAYRLEYPYELSCRVLCREVR